MELVNSSALPDGVMSGEMDRESCWRIVAIVEWEGSVKLDPITSLLYSMRRRGRVWKGSGVSAISMELVNRMILYSDMQIGSSIHKRYVDADYETLKLGEPQSSCQLYHLQ